MLGSNHFVEGKVVPKWDDLADEEDSQYENLTCDLDLTQRGVIYSNAKFIQSRIEIMNDVSKQKNH